VVTCLTAVHEVPGLSLTTGSTFITTTIVILSLGHGLLHLLALFKSTQPSTRPGTVKWVSAFRLNYKNNWRWWMQMVAASFWLAVNIKQDRLHIIKQLIGCAWS